MLVKVSFAKINGEKVLVQWNFVIFSVSNCFTLFKIFGDTHSCRKNLFFQFVFSDQSYLLYLWQGNVLFLAFHSLLHANKQSKHIKFTELFENFLFLILVLLR